MKFAISILILLISLAACGPGTNPPVPSNQNQTEENSADEGEVLPNSPLPTPANDETGVSNSPLATPEADVDSSTANPVAIGWNEDPTALIISATYCCGFTTQLVPLNYVADASVWGDGRIVWVDPSQVGTTRQVLEGKLTPEQLQAFLQKAAEAGFFSWEDRYADENIADIPDQCLSIRLESQTKQVCEYGQGAPAAFHQLYDELASGADATGTAYVPEKAYLQALKIEGETAPTTPVDAVWSAETMGFSLEEATQGRWLEGETLAQVWEIVNANWARMIIQEGDAYYQLSIQVPDISLTPPPPQ
jgi:hypothetical protein